MAPMYIKIFMHYVEKHNFYHLVNKPTAYFSYIDIFLIGPHGTDTSTNFVENANSTHPKLSFTHENSKAAASIWMY